MCETKTEKKRTKNEQKKITSLRTKTLKINIPRTPRAVPGVSTITVERGCPQPERDDVLYAMRYTMHRVACRSCGCRRSISTSPPAQTLRHNTACPAAIATTVRHTVNTSPTRQQKRTMGFPRQEKGCRWLAP